MDPDKPDWKEAIRFWDNAFKRLVQDIPGATFASISLPWTDKPPLGPDRIFVQQPIENLLGPEDDAILRDLGIQPPACNWKEPKVCFTYGCGVVE